MKINAETREVERRLIDALDRYGETFRGEGRPVIINMLLHEEFDVGDAMIRVLVEDGKFTAYNDHELSVRYAEDTGEFPVGSREQAMGYIDQCHEHGYTYPVVEFNARGEIRYI